MKSSHTFGCTKKARGPRLAARDPAKEGNPMFLITAVDDSGGLLFNQRRQSQDRLLRARILDLTGDAPLWMDAYSAGLFEPPAANIRVAEDFLDQAGAGEYCLLEDREAAPYLDKIEKIILYRWNRAYPGDFFFDIDLNEGWRKISSTDFPGSSHEKITEEVYVK